VNRARARVLARGLGWTLAFATPVAARAWIEAQSELDEADGAASAGDVDAEIEHLGRALPWRVPLSSHDEAALARLVAIGEAAESDGDVAAALAAYREARGALLATRVLAVPHADARADLEHRIARLMADEERRLGTDSAAGDDLEAHHLALLQETPGPDPWRTTLAAGAFVAWVVTSLAVLWVGIDETGRVRPRPAVWWGLASVVCLVAWMIAWRVA
jgi:hypothetical protein